jgi:hypothetical protein
VQLRHAPVVHILATTHGVREVHLPVVAVVDIRKGGGNPAFGHDGVRFAEQRLADEADRNAGRRRFNRRAQSRSAGADDEHVVLVGLVVHQQKTRNSQVSSFNSQGSDLSDG